MGIALLVGGNGGVVLAEQRLPSGVVALIVAGAVALGAQGDPQPPRQGSVLKALERRSDPNSPPEDNS